MRVLFLLFAASTSINVMAADISHYQKLLDQAYYTELQNQIMQQPDYDQQSDILVVYAKSLINQQRLEDANTLLNYAIEQFPQHSELNYLAGLYKIKLAGDGNIFAAKDRAARGIILLQKAITLNPDNFKAHLALIDFYNIAPTSAGGNKALAHELANALLARNSLQGALALSQILATDKKYDEALQVIDKYLTDPPQPQLLMKKAQILQAQGHVQPATDYYLLTAKHAVESANKYHALYQIGRLTVASNLDASIGIEALQQYITYYGESENSRLNWAKLRLAQLYLQKNDLDQASRYARELETAPVIKEDAEYQQALLDLIAQLTPPEEKIVTEAAQQETTQQIEQ